ncbi:(3R)-hydroxymyristol acyl carrier protein dehydratase [Gammaproteobacteria bacterium]|nr:(3R)-hydroxymyristol acyl carrier protein dehydratase [Gammaproteobacteria bacterium]
MRFAEQLSQSNLTKTHVCLSLRLCPELFWFKGHFPQLAILPGVTQLAWVMDYAKEILGLNYPFLGFEFVKFQMPLQPNDIIELTLDWDNLSQKLSFQYKRGSQIASKGRIKLDNSVDSYMELK